MLWARGPGQTLDGGGPCSPGCRVRLQRRDPDEFAEALSYPGAEVHQTGRGPFRGSVRLLQAGAGSVLHLSVNRAIHARGAKPNTYGFDLFTEANQSVKMQGRSLRPGMISAIGPPGEWQHVSAAPTTHPIDVAIDTEVLRRSAEVLHKVDLEERLGGFRALRPDPAAFGELDAFLRRLFPRTRPDAAQVVDPGRHREVEQRCIELLLCGVLSGELATDEPRRARNHAQVVNRAVEFMLANLDQPLLTADLCQELGVSSRTLRYAFEDQLGLSPMAYFKARKLASVRRQLRSAAGGSVPVYEVARQWGFRHTGTFAADYRRQFGERPSETLGNG